MDEERVQGTAPADRAEEQQDEQLTPEAELALREKLREMFVADYKAEQGNRARSEKWDRYSLGGRFQWDEDADADAGQEPDAATDTPELSINLIPQFRNQIVNDQRKNRQRIRVRPKGGGAKREAAQVIAGIIRDIEHESVASWAYDSAMEQAVDGAYAYLWVEPVYVDDETNNQELRIGWVPSRFDVVWDKASQLPWGGDARHAFRTGMMDTDELIALGGAAAEAAKEAGAGWPREWGEQALWEEKDGRKRVRVCSAWWLESRSVEIDGVRRPAVKRALKWCKFTARRIIEGPRTMHGHRIPGVRVVGNMKMLREGQYLYGLTELVGPQQSFFNFAANDLATRLSMKPLAAAIAPEGSLGDDGEHEGDWIDAASGKPKGVLYYKPMQLDDNTLAPPPQILPFPEVPAASLAMFQSAEHWLRAGTGMYEASQGQALGADQSGRALLQLRREGDSATFHYHDNMTYSMWALGEILVELIPFYYDWQETARILNDEHEEEFRQLAKPGTLFEPGGKEPAAMQKRQKAGGGSEAEVIYDLSVGRYAVAVDTGPSSATQREESVQFIAQTLPAMKEHALLGMDRFFANMDIPEAEVLAERYHALAMQIYPWLADLDAGSPEGPSERQKVVRLNAQVAVLKQQLEQLVPELQRLQAEVQDKSQEMQVRLFESRQKAYIAQLEAQFKLLSDIVEAEGQRDIEELRAAVKLGTERVRAIVAGMTQPPTMPRLDAGAGGPGDSGRREGMGMGMGIGPGPAGMDQ